MSNVSSSTPAAIRVSDFDWFMDLGWLAAASDIFGLVEVDSVAAGADIVGLDTAGVDALPAVDEVPAEDSIVSVFRSLAQPATMIPKNIIQIAFLSMSYLRQIVLTQSTLSEAKKQGKEK